ncbi:hypothetical protein VTL71DRAFT_12303 [Oculimacula yallundae]|uniref:Uncharacterized protein n=1 Tax=Oculimacula yallundae TaxID=86028 RepID=A0ABR4CMA3_9HELO
MRIRRDTQAPRRYPTRAQTQSQIHEAALQSLINDSHARIPDPDEQAPISYTRACDTMEGPMAPVIAGVQLLGLGCIEMEPERGRLFDALAEALGRVEREMGFQEEMRPFVRLSGNGDGKVGVSAVGVGVGVREGVVHEEGKEKGVLGVEERKDSMCSKVPFVEWLVEVCGKVDGGSVRVLLRYVGDVCKEMEGVFDGSERDEERRRMESGDGRGQTGGWKEPQARG